MILKFILVELIFILLLWGCKHEEFVPCETPLVGTLNVNTNYPDWHNSSCRFGYNSSDKISIMISSIDAVCSKDEVTISSIDFKVGKINYLHSIISEPFNNFGFTTFTEYTGEDGIKGIFNLIKNDSNFLNIESIDTVKNEIKGIFNLTFVPDATYGTVFKDTVYFKNSSFTAKLVK
jgi:hypothetical protein